MKSAQRNDLEGKTTLSAYNYLYNGKELQDDLIGPVNLNLYDFHTRYYDPVIGRFTTQDPMTESMSSWSPYIFTYDNPIKFNDPTGMVPTDFLNEDGDLIKHIDDGSNAVFQLAGDSKSNQYFKFIGFNNQGENSKNIVNLGSAIEGAQEYVHENFTSTPNYKTDDKGEVVKDDNGNPVVQDWTTYCNYATSFIAKTAFSAAPSLDISDISSGTARTMGSSLSESLRVDNVSPGGAEKAAKSGNLVVGYFPGHVFTLRKGGRVNNVGSPRPSNTTFPTSYRSNDTKWYVIKQRQGIRMLNLNKNEY